MDHFFRYYPSYLRFLIPVFALQQAAYFLFEFQIQLNHQYETGDTFFSAGLFYEYKLPITGILIVFAGAISESLQNVKKVLLYSVSAMLLGHLLTIFNKPDINFLGAIITVFASSLCFIKLILNISILFPVANDSKDNSIVLSILGGSVLSVIVLMLLSFLGHDFYELALLIAGIVLYLILLYLINGTDDLGYEIMQDEEEPSEEEEEEEEAVTKGKWALLGGVLINLIALITYVNISFLATIGSSENDLFGLIDSYTYTPYIGYLLAFGAAMIYLWNSLKKEPESKQIEKIIFGFIILFGLGVLDLINGFAGIYFLEFFISSLPHLVVLLLITSPILSIITHLNFGKNAGLWIGILFGFPQIINYIVIEVTSLISLQIVAWGCMLLIVALIIYLRENKAFLKAQLALEEPNQEIEEASEEDPFDHLIDRSSPA